MSGTAVSAPAATEAAGAPSGALRWVRRVTYVALGLQLIGLMVWSAIQNGRFAETRDYAIYHQAWYLIAHGDLYPYDTAWGLYFARGDSEYIIWLLAPFYWVWPHGAIQLWLQDIGVVCAELIAFSWIQEIARNIGHRLDSALLAAAGAVLLIADPWIWWSVSFDFHIEPVVAPFAMLLVKDILSGRRRAWVWALLTIGAGAQTAVYVAGAGVCGILAGKRSRLTGALMLGVSAGYSLVLALAQVNTIAAGDYYGYLATGSGSAARAGVFRIAEGVLSHPMRVIGVLWEKRRDIVANLMPGGFLGIANLPMAPLLLVVALEAFLVAGVKFTQPSFQNTLLYVLMPVGTVAVLGWLAGRHRRTALLLAALLVAQSLGWASVWAPRTPGQWLRVSPATAATLGRIRSRIQPSAEVVASQGVAGGFSGRANVRPLFARSAIPVGRAETWFVITPMAGIETLTTASQMGLIAELAGPLHAKLVVHAGGVWAFRWQPPAGVRSVTVPGGQVPLEAWESPGAAGRAVLHGPVADWHVRSTGRTGYVADGLAWQVPAGRYRAAVTMSVTAPVDVEVWDDTGNVLLSRRSVPETAGVQDITLPVDAGKSQRAQTYSGWGPFRAYFYPPPPGDRVEIRVWSPGHGEVKVYRAELTPVHKRGQLSPQSLT